ncbi:MAG: class I SAM-dependent methyltransferase [Candidatus Acidiferrales bacterium]
MRTEPTPLAAILSERIRASGPITFAEYMDACLYHPEHGYYAKSGQQPRRDYFTSVDVSPLFGRLLARQFHEMWIHLDRPEPFTLVEVGVGTGALAKQVLDLAAESLKDFYAALRYVAVERSAVRRVAQAAMLESHLANGRVIISADLPAQIPCGCIFSNELFDAMPAHRVTREHGELRELYVAAAGDGLHEQTGPLSTPALSNYFAEQGITLEDQQQAEACLEACWWIEGVANKLGRGFVLTIDYGHPALELYNERHMRGTLLAYARHRASEDYFRAPGEQDLTTHVNFTALEIWGARGGMNRTGFTTQSNFLLALARRSEFEDLQSETMTEQQQARARLLFKTLIYPEGMGETFQVLVQHKGIESPRLAGFDPL